MGYTELIQQNEENSNNLEYLDQIKLILEKGKSIVNRILAISDQGKITNVSIDLNALIEKITAKVAKSYSDNSLFFIILN